MTLNLTMPDQGDLKPRISVFGVGGDEIIGIFALAMQADLPYTRIQETVLPHPTVAELVPWLFSKLRAPG